eukprot:TRINITY_DN2877_c0_g2_i3.p1 TRINITY_DN2877_c0_g2~~TRINITY_DN2877_c0_g2_i3.p1  ORF type:complete len:467 (+),score=65.26 TRINITY_DN2877_c0_g2_i3:190-1590(+)
MKEKIAPDNDLHLPSILKAVASLSLPNMLIFYLLSINDTTSLIFITRTGREDYSAIMAAGSVIVGMIGYQPLNAIATTLDGLIPQAFGIHNYKVCGDYLNKTLIFLTMSSVVSTILTLVVDRFLVLIGFERPLAESIGLYAFSMFLSTYFSCVFQVLSRFMNGQKVANPQLVIIIITSCLHALWCYLFIVLMDFGLLGLAFAYTMTGLVNCILAAAYISRSKELRKSIVMPDSRTFDNFSRFLKVSANNIVNSILDWWGYYIIMLSAAYSGETMSAANQIAISHDNLFYTIPLGVGSALTSLVGNKLSQRKILEAKKYSAVCVLFNTGLTCVLMAVFYVFRHTIISLYTPNLEIQKIYMGLLPLALASFFMNCLQAILGRIFIAQRKLRYLSLNHILIYYVLMLPLGYFIIMRNRMGIAGIWITTTISLGMYSLRHLIKLPTQNWEAIADELVEEKKHKNDGIKAD